MVTLTMLIFLFPLAYSPGPGNLFFAAHGARFGWRQSLPAFIGYHAATLGAALATGAGLLLLTGPTVTGALGVAGTLYLLWLAYRLWQAGNLADRAHATRAGILDGAALLVLNPKAWAIMATLFAHYPGSETRQILWVATVFTLNNAVAFGVWTLLGDRLLARVRDPARMRLVNRGFAALLAAIAILLALR